MTVLFEDKTCSKVTIQDHEETPSRDNEAVVTCKRTQKLPSVWELNTHHSLSLYVRTKTQESEDLGLASFICGFFLFFTSPQLFCTHLEDCVI